MGLIERFEDRLAWPEARELTPGIYRIPEGGTLSRDFELRDQLRRASVSAMANIAEGFDRDSKVEVARFLGIARRSAVEVPSLLYVALDAGHLDEVAFGVHYAQAAKAKALIGGFKHALTRRRSPT
jgi:four helix bundle protein